MTDEVVRLKTSRDYIEVQQCDLDVEQELREAYATNGPVVSIIAEFREECARAALPNGLREALEDARNALQTVLDSCGKRPVGGGDGQTYSVSAPSGPAWNLALATITKIDATLSATSVQPEVSEAMENRIAKAIQNVRDEIGATEQQRIAFGYAEAAMREQFAALRSAAPREPEVSEAVVEAVARALIEAGAFEEYAEPRLTHFATIAARAAIAALPPQGEADLQTVADIIQRRIGPAISREDAVSIARECLGARLPQSSCSTT